MVVKQGHRGRAVKLTARPFYFAEDLRAAYGYSGGEDGSDNITISTTDGTGTKQTYPIRDPQLQDDRINNQYDKAIDAATAAIEGAYQQSMIDVDAAAAKIPGTYQAARNQVAGNAAVERANFNEYAAAAGLNSGAGGQAQLSMGNQLQGNLASISQEEANAQKDLETQRLRLKTQYQNDVAQAIANGEYQRAAALAQEGVRVDEAMVAMSQARADEAYRTWALNYQTRQNDQNAARSQVMEILQMGGTPSQTLLDAAGFDPSYIAAMQGYYAPKAGRYSAGDGSKIAQYDENSAANGTKNGTYQALAHILSDLGEVEGEPGWQTSKGDFQLAIVQNPDLTDEEKAKLIAATADPDIKWTD